MKAIPAEVLEIAAPRRAAVVPVEVGPPGTEQLLVRSRCSVISAGAELLAYHGELPGDLALDDTIGSLDALGDYPLRYGYCLVGRVEAGDPAMAGRRVFVFAPHQSHVVADQDAVIPIPDDIADEDAVFLAHAETVVNLLQDGAPRAGEAVAILGQGLVGLLLTGALSHYPLSTLSAVDPLSERRRAAEGEGADAAVAPDEFAAMDVGAFLTDDRRYPGFDLVYELSGNPAAADQALQMCGYSGRVILGSWYGTKAVTLHLGGRFHRSRITLYSSQVSTIGPALTGAFDKSRRFAAAWDLIRRARPGRFISTRIPFGDGGTAYDILDGSPESVLTVLLDYGTAAPRGTTPYKGA